MLSYNAILLDFYNYMGLFQGSCVALVYLSPLPQTNYYTLLLFHNYCNIIIQKVSKGTVLFDTF